MAVAGAAPGSEVEEFSVWGSFRDLWSEACESGLLAVAVDIPIGLPGKGGRSADMQARKKLKGPPSRAPSVFPSPALCTLGARNYEQALERSRRQTGSGLSKQAYALMPKIMSVRCALEDLDAFKSEARPKAAEVHPEVSFQEMAGTPMRFHKSRQAGFAERLTLLQCHFPNIVEAAVCTGITGPPAPGLDDVLDAAAAAWTARRLVAGKAECLGGAERDQTGYPMSIWV